MRKSDLRDVLATRPSLLARVTYPAIVGLAVFFAYPSIVSQPDASALAPELDGPRWLASIAKGPGVSNFLASGNANAAVRLDPVTTGSVASLSGGAPHVTFGVKSKREPQVVNRSAKGGRVVSATVARPPEHFSAGSVLERQSMLGPLSVGKDFELAFVKAKPFEEAIQVASAFHPKVDRQKELLEPEADLPVMVASLVRESADNVLAYAPEPKQKRSPFAAVLNQDEPISIVPKLDKNDHQWALNPLPAASFSDTQQDCLARGIYFEARGEPVKGQAAVAQVILNRVKNPTYPDSICGVVYQNKNWRNRCQFSFACDRIADRVRDQQRWEIAKYVARETTEGRIWLKEVGSSTHYHATYVHPKWANTMKRVGRIGLHVFYRTFGGGWS